MNKIVASVGLVAFGATALQAGSIPGFSADSPKPWSVSASLRGFYDDNVNTLPDNDARKHDTYGFEVSPSIAFGWALPQTKMEFRYTYSFKYYDHTPIGNSDKYDQSHMFDASLDHAFSDRYKISVNDSFVIGQEPDLLRVDNSMASFQRIPGDNIRNYGTINFDAQLTPLFGLQLGYANQYWHYDNGSPLVAGISELLNRIEHTVHVDTRWTIQPETIGVFGYSFRLVNYTGNQISGLDANLNPVTVNADERDFREHAVYVGADHTFRPDFTGSVRLGARYTEYYNESGSPTDWGPYARASLRWTYLPESYFEAGVSHDINATDVLTFNASGTRATQTQESTVVYGTLSHRIIPKLYGNITGQYQHSSWFGGAVDGQNENYFLVGLNVRYKITPNFSTEVGYNYDKLDSDLGFRSFDRNRIYIGIAANY